MKSIEYIICSLINFVLELSVIQNVEDKKVY